MEVSGGMAWRTTVLRSHLSCKSPPWTRVALVTATSQPALIHLIPAKYYCQLTPRLPLVFVTATTGHVTSPVHPT